jgi:hypothetical protein
MSADPSCSERVQQNMDGRLTDLAGLWFAYQNGADDGGWLRMNTAERVQFIQDMNETALAEFVSVFAARRDDPPLEGDFSEYGLSFDYVAPDTFNDQPEGYYRYQLSWGGPSDEFRFYVGQESDCHAVEYWFLDWYDGASRTLYRGTPGGDLMREIWSWFAEIGGCTSHQH